MLNARSVFSLFFALASTACSSDGTECGPNTHEQDGVCIADMPGAGGVQCGAGTHEVNGTCVADDGTVYELRISDSRISADGHSKVPVLALGTRADGTPATDEMVLGIDRAAAGAFVEPNVTLAALGTTAYYVPCKSTVAQCTGPVKLTMALASAPETPLVSLDAELIEPAGVGSAAACLGGGNALFLDGNDWIYNGTMTVGPGLWSSGGSSSSVVIDVTPLGLGLGLWWHVEFTSSGLASPLDAGVYEGAERSGVESTGHPGMEISGDGRWCDTIVGRFQIHEHTRDDQGLVSATVSFEQHCEGGAEMLSGCVHYARN